MNNTPRFDTTHPDAPAVEGKLPWEWLRDAFAEQFSQASSRQGGGIGAIDWVAFTAKVSAYFGPAMPLKDHLIGETADKLVEAVSASSDDSNFRSRFLEVLEPVLRGEMPVEHTCVGKGGSYQVLGTAKPAGPMKDAGIGLLTFYADTVTGAKYYRAIDDAKLRIVPTSQVSTEAGGCK